MVSNKTTAFASTASLTSGFITKLVTSLLSFSDLMVIAAVTVSNNDYIRLKLPSLTCKSR
jgi:hypothetical protein